MRIRLKRDINGADGTARAGETVEWSDAIANGLLEGGYAEIVTDEREPVAEEAPEGTVDEAADADEVADEPEPETAVTRPRRAKRPDAREAAGSE